MGALAHILNCSPQHLRWNGRCNVLYRLLQVGNGFWVNTANLVLNVTQDEKSKEGSGPDCKAAICVLTAINGRSLFLEKMLMFRLVVVAVVA